MNERMNDDDNNVLNVQASSMNILTVPPKTGRLQRCIWPGAMKLMSYLDLTALQASYTWCRL